MWQPEVGDKVKIWDGNVLTVERIEPCSMDEDDSGHAEDSNDYILSGQLSRRFGSYRFHIDEIEPA